MLDPSRRQARSQLISQKAKISKLATKESLAQKGVRSESRSTRTRKSPNSLVKSISKKCNMLAQQQQLNLTTHVRCFITLIKINDCRLIAIIDFDTISNFMAKALVEKEGYSTRKKPNAYNLITVDGNSLPNKNERVNRETKSLSIAIQQHHEKLIFNIVEMITYDIVLKML